MTSWHQKKKLSEAEKIILIDLLNSWGYAYYYLGEFKEFIDIFKSHQAIGRFTGRQGKSRDVLCLVWHCPLYGWKIKGFL